MSNIDPSQQSLSAILNKLGINSSEKSNVPKAKDQLGQEDFLKLMTTQLQNQDPFAPMENGEFIAQMAQFSTVTGITSMDESLKNVAAKLGETRIATAANMLGHSVLVPGKIARADDDGSVNGVIDLPSASTNVNVVFKSQNGEIIDTINLGNQSSGLVGFAWHGAPKDMIENDEPIFVEAYANSGKGMEGVSSSIFAEVLSSSAGDGDSGVMLDVRDYGTISANEVIKFRM
jgi:flagellar basal-body rod modification protein FlgD|tara:strand:+ start:131 stop:826 length:696 start_codon:yes stop_codon:yes gene_type:complete